MIQKKPSGYGWNIISDWSFTDINRKRTRLSGDSLVLFLQKKAELQKKPVFRIIQINLCELLDALQTVGQGTSMYKKLPGCLKRIAFMLQIDLECVI